jgi:hypothetical protein
VNLNAAMSALSKALAADIAEQLKPMLVELPANRNKPRSSWMTRSTSGSAPLKSLTAENAARMAG